MAFRRQLGRIVPCLSSQILKGQTPLLPSRWRLCGDTGTLEGTWKATAAVETSAEAPQKITHGLTTSSNNPLLGMYPKELGPGRMVSSVCHLDWALGCPDV